MKKSLFYKAIPSIALSLSIASTLGFAQASPTSNLTQVINGGSLAVDILNASRASVASPAISMSAKSFSFDCQNGGTSSTGTLGTNTERLYAMNPGASVPNGWNVTIAASAPTATWVNSGATKLFDFNDASTSGCTDGADADSYGGQMTIDPSVGTLTADCTTCNLTGVSKGSSTSFVEGTTDNITLISAANTASNPFRGYLTGAAVSQTIPAEQSPDSTYSLDLTLTITAL